MSAIAALVLERKSDLDANDIVDALGRSATDLGKSGKDPLYGHGLVDAYGAVRNIAAGEPKQKLLSDRRAN